MVKKKKEGNAMKVFRGRSTSRQMVTNFFSITGHVAIEQRRVVNSEWHTVICAAEILGEIRKKSIVLQNDNALTKKELLTYQTWNC